MIKSKLKTIKRLIKENPKGLILAAGRNGLLNFIPDYIYLKLVFKAEMGYRLNLKNPKTYNEKLQWIKLYDRKQEYTMFADKYAVREYVAKTIGEQYLVPLIGVYESVYEIPWDKLPNRFVLKCTHGSGTNIICTDKETFNIEDAVNKLTKWLKKSFYWGGREWCYKNIPPRIICEQFIDTPDGNTPDDYKFMCFNGEPKLIQLHHDRYGKHTLDFYDTLWRKTDICQVTPNSDYIAPKPELLNNMLCIARKLSAGMAYSRIDLYYQSKKIYFGEITMYPTSGFSSFRTIEQDIKLGSWIKLPK